MFCPECGEKIKDNDLFCGNCGCRIISEYDSKAELLQTNNPKPEVKHTKKSNKSLIFLCVTIGAVILAIGIFVAIKFHVQKPNEAKTQAETNAIENNLSEAPEKMPDEAVPHPLQNTESKSSINLLSEMSNDEIRNLNVFLSNFSEAYFYDYDKADLHYDRLVDFAFIHNMINTSTPTLYEGSEMGISRDRANTIIDKYFGLSAPPENLLSSEEYGHDWTYKNGAYWRSAASGESYNAFSIAKEMVKNNDGTYSVDFDAFYCAEFEPEIPMSQWYSYTIDEANRDFNFYYSGTAVIKDKVYNGKNTYELIKIYKE